MTSLLAIKVALHFKESNHKIWLLMVYARRPDISCSTGQPSIDYGITLPLLWGTLKNKMRAKWAKWEICWNSIIWKRYALVYGKIIVDELIL